MPEPLPFGNPSHNTFAKRFIRLVVVDETRIKVHVKLQSVIELLLRHLSEQDVELERVEGYPTVQNGAGLVLVAKEVPVEAVREAMAGYGFQGSSDLSSHLYLWGGTVAEADAANVEAEAQLAAALRTPTEAQGDAGAAATGDEQVNDAPSPDGLDWSSVEDYQGKPGSRELDGTQLYAGRDIRFLQAYLQVPVTGRYDLDTMAAVAALKAKKGQEPDGTVTTEVWKQLLPRVRQHLRRGEMGRQVRIITAALVAAGFLDEPSSGFNRPVELAVRSFQEASKLRPTGRVASFEWGALLHHPW